jgi:hypothetical protein
MKLSWSVMNNEFGVGVRFMVWIRSGLRYIVILSLYLSHSHSDSLSVSNTLSLSLSHTHSLSLLHCRWKSLYEEAVC